MLWHFGRLALRDRTGGGGDGQLLRRVAVRRRRDRGATGRGGAGQPGVRQPAGRCGLARGRAGAGPGLRRRDRRAALGPAGRPLGMRLRRGHDGGHADPGPGERGQGRGGQRGIPQGRDRGPPAARRLGRRGDLQLRDQPVHRQARRAGGDVPGPGPRRPDRHLRRRGRGPPDPGRPGGCGRLRRVHRRRPVPCRVPGRAGRGRVHGRVGDVHRRASPGHALGRHPGRQARQRLTPRSGRPGTWPGSARRRRRTSAGSAAWRSRAPRRGTAGTRARSRPASARRRSAPIRPA
jgi:hypothetical protein